MTLGAALRAVTLPLDLASDTQWRKRQLSVFRKLQARLPLNAAHPIRLPI